MKTLAKITCPICRGSGKNTIYDRRVSTSTGELFYIERVKKCVVCGGSGCTVDMIEQYEINKKIRAECKKRW